MGWLKSLFQMPRYNRFVVLSDSSQGKLWDYVVWKDRVFPSLNRVVKVSKCSSLSVRCRQITKGQSKEVAFGTIEWSPDDAVKWCHHTPATEGRDVSWLFVDLQVWSPAKDTLVKEGRFPCLYIQVKPMVWEGDVTKAIYTQAIHLAFLHDEYVVRPQEIESTMRDLAHAVGAVGLYSTLSRVTSLNAFESLVREDFKYLGILQDALPDERKMKGRWTRLDVDERGLVRPLSEA